MVGLPENSLPPSKALRIVNASLELMEALRCLPSVQAEVDASTGVQFVGNLGACGSTPDMPRDLAERYLTHELIAISEGE
tara:strand:+ start:530 stop:769 length:240 start_codon:yes stop_codon:yes gene_type:complete